MTKTIKSIDEMNFEDAQAALGEIIHQLEENPSDLEEAVGLFERGKALIDHCQTLLDKAELRVSQLDDDGNVSRMDA